MGSFRLKLYKYYVLPNILVVLTIVFGIWRYHSFIHEYDVVLNDQIQISKEIEFLSSATELIAFREAKRGSFYLNHEDESWTEIVLVSLEGIERNFNDNKEKGLLNLYEYRKSVKIIERLKFSIKELISRIKIVGFKNWGLIGSFRSNIHEVEKILRQNNSYEALSIMLEIRRHEKDFLLREELKYQKRLNEKIKLLKEKIKALKPFEHSLVLDNLTAYQNKFNQMVTIKTEIGKDSSAGLKKEYTENILNLLVNQSNIIQRVKDDKLNKIQIIKIVVVLVTVLVLIFLLFYTIRISTDLSMPIKKLRAAFESLAGGNLEENITYEGNDEFKDVFNRFNEMTSELKSKQEEIVKERNTNIFILESLNEYICLADEEGKILYSNKSFRQNLGAGRVMLSDIFEDKWNELAPEFFTVEVNHLDTKIKNSSDEIIPIEFSTRFFRREEKRFIVLSIENQQDSVLLKQLKDTQEQLVQSAKLASLGEMNSSLGHELNNPLQIISGMVEVLADVLIDEKDEVVVESLGQLKSNIKRMTNIIDHLRSFSRKEGTDFKPYDLNDVLADSFILCNSGLRNNNIKVDIKNTEEKLMVNMKKTTIEQVFINLINNAKDAILEHKSKLDKAQITCELKQQGGKALFSINNQGPKIDGEILEKTFDPFFSTKDVGKGTGLGLSISHKIISDHQGNIWATSDDSNGTTFYIELPTI